jgi:hypothetical protein
VGEGLLDCPISGGRGTGEDMSSSAVMLPFQTRKEPAIIHAGDTVSWDRAFSGYSPQDYTLTYVIVSPFAQYIVAATAADGAPNVFHAQIPAATTADWVQGVYRWEAYLKNATGDRVTIDQGQLTVSPNFETATQGIDARDDDEKALDAIKVMLSGKVTEDAQRYVIHGRELQRYTMAELLNIRNVYALRVRRNRVLRGERVSSRTVKVGFGA